MTATRTTDPETSLQAAQSVRNVTKTQQAIMSLLVYAMTDEQLNNAYAVYVKHGLAPMASQSGVRSRRAELVAQGLVADTGKRAILQSGRKAILWQKTDTIN